MPFWPTPSPYEACLEALRLTLPKDKRSAAEGKCLALMRALQKLSGMQNALSEIATLMDQLSGSLCKTQDSRKQDALDELSQVYAAYQRATLDYFSHERIRGGINSALCKAWLDLYTRQTHTNLLPSISTLMRHAAVYAENSRKIKKKSSSPTEQITIDLEFFAGRELNFSLNTKANRAAIKLYHQLNQTSPRSKPVQTLLQLIKEQSIHVQAAKRTPERGSNHLFIPAIGRQLAQELANNEEICEQMLTAHTEQKYGKRHSGSTVSLIHRGARFVITPLPSGSGVAACFKAKAPVFDGLTMLLKIYQFEKEDAEGSLFHTNQRRDHFASDMVTVTPQQANYCAQVIELQEWIENGTELSKVPQTSVEDTWDLIERITKFTAENHADHRTLTDLTLANLWDCDGCIIVPDKKSYCDLRAFKLNEDEIDNPELIATDPPLFTPCYQPDRMSQHKGKFHWQPYQLCNQSLAMCIAYLIDSCKRVDAEGKPVLPQPTIDKASDEDIQHIFDEAYTRMNTDEWERIEPLIAAIRSLRNPTSNRYVVGHVLNAITALSGKSRRLLSRRHTDHTPFGNPPQTQASAGTTPALTPIPHDSEPNSPPNQSKPATAASGKTRRLLRKRHTHHTPFPDHPPPTQASTETTSSLSSTATPRQSLLIRHFPNHTRTPMRHDSAPHTQASAETTSALRSTATPRRRLLIRRLSDQTRSPMRYESELKSPPNQLKPDTAVPGRSERLLSRRHSDHTSAVPERPRPLLSRRHSDHTPSPDYPPPTQASARITSAANSPTLPRRQLFTTPHKFSSAAPIVPTSVHHNGIFSTRRNWPLTAQKQSSRCASMV